MAEMLLTTEQEVMEVAEPDRLAIDVLQQLETAGVAHCVLRGGDELLRQSTTGEIDLLVAKADFGLLTQVLRANGFVRLRAWGHRPHHFFLKYDSQHDRWLKWDVVTAIAYGRPIHALRTDLATNCLRRRRRLGPLYISSAADEFTTLLLHCLLDKGEFPPHWRLRLKELHDEISDEKPIADCIARYFPQATSVDEIRTAIAEDRWQDLLALRRGFASGIQAGCHARVAVQRLTDRLLRKSDRLIRLFRPTAISVAILAPDGAGKSTLAEGLVRNCYFPVRQIYMGLYQQRDTKSKGRLRGVGLLGKLATQWSRYARGHLHKAHGRFVIFDRYTYDALLPSKKRLSRWQRLRRSILARACPPPDLIVVLDAPGELLFARKREHSAEYLEQHRQAYLALGARFPNLVVVDATRPADEVRRCVTAQIWQRFATRTGS